jgi:hypothetical protein
MFFTKKVFNILREEVTRRLTMFTDGSNRPGVRICPAMRVLVMSFLLVLTGCAATTGQQAIAEQSYIDDVHYLSEYGVWVDYPPYGAVWQPDVVPDWEPFYYGHWIWTNDGWAWTSYEPYGWLVYHYGNWGFEPGFGWFWVPGDTWWPARVQWYTFGDYAAWAPIPPPHMVWPDPWAPYDIDIWIVVHIDHFTYEDIGRHRVRRPVYGERTLSRTVVRQPPDVGKVEKITRSRVSTVRVREQRTEIQPRTDSRSTAVERRERTLKRMVLPRTEKRKVEKHTSQVEREVLNPRSESQERRKKTTDRSTDTKRRKK